MEEILLWPNGVSGAKGDTKEDTPSIVPYIVNSGDARGAIIICPGGGYVRRACHEGEPVALWLNSIGISAFVLNYCVAPSYRYPYPFMDMQRVIRYVRYNAADWNIEPNHIGIMGFSAGGHLASTVGTHFDNGSADVEDPINRMSCRPDAMILCYPVITFGEYRHHGSMVSLIGENPSDELIKLLSNELHVMPDTPPAFLWHTADDQAVHVQNSLLFAEALRRCGVPFELHIYPHGRHGLGLALGEPSVSSWTELCARWLKNLGF
ncbi:alpha/beta hydrolase [Caldicoprobacter algeriensis]|uniref:alpha/beta hydrolase n=1 Tax=Caldicoprobacter algeriensis TaxID=699281 RepID=UPI002079E223|nr:alpha/beta hydrolase [Caldicoprobacter algeriensis]MCM8901920.1 alpha/beta hydrolase [Caldicoprobacter algeriensis]